MESIDNNVPESFVPATKTDSQNLIVITSDEAESKIIDALLKKQIPQEAIGYANVNGLVGGIYVNDEYALIAAKICNDNDIIHHYFTDENFDEAKRIGLVNYLEHKRNEILETNPVLFNKYDRLQRSIEKAQQQKVKNSISIKFICDQEINYFRDEAPVASNLLSIIKNGNVQTFIRQGIVGQLVGCGGIGKTHFLTQLALSVAAGVPFFNEYSTGNGGHVFMMMGENEDEEIHRLLKKLSVALPIDKAEKRLAVMSLCGKSAAFVDKNGNTTDFYNQLFAELKRSEPVEGWKLIVIDPISRVLGAQAENDNAAATEFISLLERFILELKGKPTVLFGHHMSKAGISNISNTDQTASRGSSAITDGVRWQSNLEKVEKATGKPEEKYEKYQVRLRIVKSNHTEVYDPIILCKVDNGRLELLNQAAIPADEDYYDEPGI